MSLSVKETASPSTYTPAPPSALAIVTDGVIPPWAPVGVQEKSPVLASMVIPNAMEAASRLKVNVSAGRSESVAVAVKLRVASSSTV